MEEINEKDQKIEDFKKQCEKINQQKAQAAIKFQRQKEEIVKKFDNLMKQNKEIEPETIKELFPEDQELYNKIKEMKEKQKQEEEKMKKSRASTANNAKDENAKNAKEMEHVFHALIKNLWVLHAKKLVKIALAVFAILMENVSTKFLNVKEVIIMAKNVKMIVIQTALNVIDKENAFHVLKINHGEKTVINPV